MNKKAIKILIVSVIIAVIVGGTIAGIVVVNLDRKKKNLSYITGRTISIPPISRFLKSITSKKPARKSRLFTALSTQTKQ